MKEETIMENYLPQGQKLLSKLYIDVPSHAVLLVCFIIFYAFNSRMWQRCSA